MVSEAPHGGPPVTILSSAKLPGRGFAIQGTEVGGVSEATSPPQLTFSPSLSSVEDQGGTPTFCPAAPLPYEIGLSVELFSVRGEPLALPPASLLRRRGMTSGPKGGWTRQGPPGRGYPPPARQRGVPTPRGTSSPDFWSSVELRSAERSYSEQSSREQSKVTRRAKAPMTAGGPPPENCSRKDF
jgi:hypothetical protein